MNDQVFPPPPDAYRVASLMLTLWDRQAGDQILTLKIDNTGGDCFPQLDLNSSYAGEDGEKIRGAADFTTDQIVALAEWSRALCHWVDAQARKGDK